MAKVKKEVKKKKPVVEPVEAISEEPRRNKAGNIVVNGSPNE